MPLINFHFHHFISQQQKTIISHFLIFFLERLDSFVVLLKSDSFMKGDFLKVYIIWNGYCCLDL